MKLAFSGCIYANPPSRASAAGPRDLTVTELRGMRFVDLPVRIEHGARALVGRVRASRTDPVNGYTSVDMELDDTPSGHAAAALIEVGEIRELSLCHEVYDSGAKEPVEISLVKEGARPHTVIFREGVSHTEAYREYVKASKMDVVDRSAMEATPPPPATGEIAAEGADPTPPAPPASAPPGDAATAATAATGTATEDEPAAKRARTSDPLAAVDEIAKQLPPEQQERLFETLNAFAKASKEAKSRAETASERVKSLEAERERILKEQSALETKYNVTKENTNSMARQLAHVMNDLYRQFTPSQALKSEQEVDKVGDALLSVAETQPEAWKHIQKMQVACSKVAEAALVQKGLSERRATERANAMRETLYETMGAEEPAASPWIQPKVGEPVTVAASKQGKRPEQQQQARGGVPDWLRQECAGIEIGASGRMSLDDVHFLTSKR